MVYLEIYMKRLDFKTFTTGTLSNSSQVVLKINILFNIICPPIVPFTLPGFRHLYLKQILFVFSHLVWDVVGLEFNVRGILSLCF